MEFRNVGAPPKTRYLYSAEGQPSAMACLTPEQALAFVAGATGALTAPEVQAHLDRCDQCRIVVGEAARSLTESSAVKDSRPKPRPLTLRVGELIAAATRFTLRRERRHGRGLRGPRQHAPRGRGAQDPPAHRDRRFERSGAPAPRGSTGAQGHAPQRVPHSRVRRDINRATTPKKPSPS